MIFWMNGTVAEGPKNDPSGPRRECAVQVFSPQVKTLAQAELISAEHLNTKGWRPPPAAGTQKERHDLRRVFLFGASDEARTRYLHLGKVALYQMSYTRIAKLL